jgi:polysaccharide pyruvyl transferase WcaK-like protein
MRVCLLGATFNTGNMGVSALTAGSIKAIIRHNPKAEIILLDYGEQAEHYTLRIDNRDVAISLLNIRFSKKIFLKNNITVLIALAFMLNFLPFKRLRSKIITGNPYLRTIDNAQVIGAISGGDSFSDIYGLERFFYVALPQILVLLLRKKLILLPQTLGPFDRQITRLFARYILNRAKLIYSRDFLGLSEIKTLLHSPGDTQKYRFCYDVGFVLDPLKPEKMELQDFFAQRKGESVIVGFNISGLLYMGGYKRNNMFKLNIDYHEFVYEIIEFLLSKENTLVLLLPHVFGNSQQSENDSTVCLRVYADLKHKFRDRLFVLEGEYNQNEIKNIIGQCDFFIGSRMHACIAALSQNIPAVAIAYSKKFFGVIQSIGMESLVADPKIMSKEKVIQTIDNAYKQRTIIRESLSIKIPQVQKAVLAEFGHILFDSSGLRSHQAS